MTIHLQKLCVGCDSVEDLAAWIAERMAAKRRRGEPQEQVHRTRMMPKQVGQLLGSARTRANAGADAAPIEEKLRQRLLKQRDHLFTFLDDEAVDATNNLAERQLRPAVISRKLSCGNKTERGAATWQILASLAATCRQTDTGFAHFLRPKLALHPVSP